MNYWAIYIFTEHYEQGTPQHDSQRSELRLDDGRRNKARTSSTSSHNNLKDEE